jgi:hypothetical protein
MAQPWLLLLLRISGHYCFVYSFEYSFDCSVYNSDPRYNDSRGYPDEGRSKHLSTKTNNKQSKSNHGRLMTDEVMAVLEDQRKSVCHFCMLASSWF